MLLEVFGIEVFTVFVVGTGELVVRHINLFEHPLLATSIGAGVRIFLPLDGAQLAEGGFTNETFQGRIGQILAYEANGVRTGEHRFVEKAGLSAAEEDLVHDVGVIQYNDFWDAAANILVQR